LDLFNQVTQIAGLSPPRSWVDYTMITAEEPQILHSFAEVHA